MLKLCFAIPDIKGEGVFHTNPCEKLLILIMNRVKFFDIHIFHLSMLVLVFWLLTEYNYLTIGLIDLCEITVYDVEYENILIENEAMLVLKLLRKIRL